jgi:uncharacterized lipoprotein YmbA
MTLLAVVAGTSACIKMGPNADVTRFFVLAPEPGTTVPVAPNGPVVGVGPVTIPAYLDRKAIVTRVGPSEVNPSETHLWAEPPATMLTQTLAANLAARLGAPRTLLFPWRRDLEPTVVVEVEFLRFEPMSDGTAVLDATWQVTVGDRVERGRSTVSEPVGASGPDAKVAALGRLLGQLSDRLATAAGGE